MAGEKSKPRLPASATFRDLKATHIPTLVELLLLGAHDHPVLISTEELGKRIGKSQQLASKHLVDLDRESLVTRNRAGQRQSIEITEKGEMALKSLLTTLTRGLESASPIFEFTGELFSGLGEGAYYVSLDGYRRQFVSKLGIDPYPGTLNMRLTTAQQRKTTHELKAYTGMRIEGFKNEQRTYGGATCYPALVNDQVDAFVLSIDRTHYDDSVLELISPVKIRDKLDLKDGDELRIKVFATK